MSKIIAIIGLTFVLTIGFFQIPKVYAHFLEVDGNMGALLHLDPSDDPIAGQTTSFYLEFKDKAGKFQPLNCTCTAEMYQNGTKVASLPLFDGNGARVDTADGQATGYSTFTFPSKDVYTMKVVGIPTQRDLFQPFTLTYSIRVARAINSSSNPSKISQSFKGNGPYEVGLGVGLLTVIGYIFRRLYKNKQ